MKKKIANLTASLYLMSFFILFSSCRKEAATILQYVDPFVGTAYTGHTFPGAAYPLGMMQPGPQTGNFEWKYCAGYRYEDDSIWGFTQTQLNGTGVTDSGDILMMPFSGVPKNKYRSSFSKNTETASPGYYSVSLADNSVDVELTAAPHVAFHRYVFHKENPAVNINFQFGNVSVKDEYGKRVLYSNIKKENNRTISGSLELKRWVERRLFFVIEFDKDIISGEEIVSDSTCKAPDMVYYFDLGKDNKLQAKVAFSTVGVDGAKLNMKSEANHWDFDKVKEEAENSWEEILSIIDVEGNLEQKKNFYTSMYHLYIQPNNIADADGRYTGSDDFVSISSFGKYYSTFSLWDTFRAAHPMYTILTPEIVPGLVNSMLYHAEAYGYLPVWALWGKETYCMIGNHAVPVVVEACLKNMPGVDQERAYGLVKQSLTTAKHRKYDWSVYDKYGYFPYDIVKEESVSMTLECGYDDYCAAQLAKKLNKEEDYEFFMKRSKYYRNVFDSESKLVRGKNSNGKWRTPFNRFHLSHAGTAGGDYTEGNAWQYTWHVQQDMEGLVELMGGKEAFAAKLDSLFVLESTSEATGFVGDVTGLIGQYAHGNEPSHHVIYLYSMLGKNARTAELVREVFDKFYKPKPDGLCGNDDCGQMSAWYMFSALGFYPVDPVSGEYILGAPQIPEATIHLSNGKSFTMIAKKISETNKYVESVTYNDKPITDFRFSYKQLQEGGRLIFNMADTP
ncbi:MAG: GH92 family glycosyl hydrolase [Prevotellaceae bacterium]|jgi:predicted alpha-1,2-mannosidase|nr:GH92 family glycosyl hydrolase [Prevotellaceae bacterium]